MLRAPSSTPAHNGSGEPTRRRPSEERQQDTFEVAMPPPEPPPRPPEHRPGWLRRSARWTRQHVVPWVPVYGAILTTLAAFFSIRNYLFLDARFTLSAVKVLQGDVEQRHQQILATLQDIWRRINGTR